MPPHADRFAEVLLPLALDGTYTYRVPDHLHDQAVIGKRVEVQFGARKKYAGLIAGLTSTPPPHRTKEILSVLDASPVADAAQIAFWRWMAGYYCCTPGEVMRAALPAALLLSSETILQALPADEDEALRLDDPLYALLGIIRSRSSITLEDAQKSSGQRTIYPLVVQLYQAGLILVSEALEEKYTPLTIRQVRLADAYAGEAGMQQALDAVARSEKQTRLVLAYLAMTGLQPDKVDPAELMARCEVTRSVLKAVIDKGILREDVIAVNRMDLYAADSEPGEFTLSPLQRAKLDEVHARFANKDVVLLHGVTGSGKTLLYLDLIREITDQGGQVLYLVPEIGLSVQVMRRLQHVFGARITISHSRLSDKERVDLWHKVADGAPVVAGVRSSIFLPFRDLRLIIVDEEHDASYKQQDPNPRYHARDMALVLARNAGAKVLLGSATPSLESYYQATNGRYGLVEIMQRYQDMALPRVQLIDQRRDKSSAGAIYSHSLIEAIRETLARKKQVIIFRNRRGYAPVMKCAVCGWVAECSQCDVSMTYHKHRNVLSCHLCGATQGMPAFCPACSSPKLVLEGYGTEKIEDELAVIFPEARMARMDADTTRGKHVMEQLIWNFEQGKLDILVGTQMVTKGLDFDHVGLVGVIQADQALAFPDFRAAERTFQSLVQVSGRAGRKYDQGLVMIQTWQPTHPVYQDVIHNDYASFYAREIKEREIFRYPPFVRQIAVTVRHRQADTSREAAQLMAMALRELFGNRIMGPTVPSIARVRNQYIHLLYIKMEREPRIMQAIKDELRRLQHDISTRKSLSAVRISVDVDPHH